MKIREFTDAAGELAAVFLRQVDGALQVLGPDGAVALPAGALDAVMARYGAPFDPDASISVVATLPLPDGRALRHIRHIAGYDVIARDYLVYEGAGPDAPCALATTVARALEHLAQAIRARAPR